jgi:hypothetical protein
VQGDYNDANIIVDPKTRSIAGIIDFGDCVNTYVFVSAMLHMCGQQLSKTNTLCTRAQMGSQRLRHRCCVRCPWEVCERHTQRYELMMRPQLWAGATHCGTMQLCLRFLQSVSAYDSGVAAHAYTSMLQTRNVYLHRCLFVGSRSLQPLPAAALAASKKRSPVANGVPPCAYLRDVTARSLRKVTEPFRAAVCSHHVLKL